MTAMFQGKPLFGPQGEPGATFTPSVSESGIISWTNDGGLPNPEPVNIKGAQGEQGPAGPVGPKGEIGPKGEDAENVYSTEETVIGTWIDGKPIYRKIVSFGDITFPGSVESDNGSISVSAPDDIKQIPFDEIIKLELASSGYSSNDLSVGDRVITFAYRKVAKVFLFTQNWSSKSQVLYSAYVIIEYTKTTDVATVSQVNLFTSEVDSPETLSIASIASNAPASL